eukprot:4989985-Amphidinium_carterae.1
MSRILIENQEKKKCGTDARSCVKLHIKSNFTSVLWVLILAPQNRNHFAFKTDASLLLSQQKTQRHAL